ncbi:hypothetical protein H7Y63_04245 [Polaromonas sp.]|nr:hypothetical protein [Candidatus Saccharibacteria bacterium]
MIQTASSSNELEATLSADFIADKAPLIGSAGFAANSAFAGQVRQTVSLPLSAATVQAIRDQVQPMYDEIISDCWPQGEPLPFDMIRFDAFLNPDNDDIKILEINTRNVGLHEVVEWLDDTVGDVIGTTKSCSLNQRFVENQKIIHTHRVGADEPLLYMSPDFIPRWKYFEALQKAYVSVVHITEPDQGTDVAEGIAVDGVVFRAITRKLAWNLSQNTKDLDGKGLARVLQPQWMRPFGVKSYLQHLSSPAILRTETYTDEHAERYLTNKDQLVLKIIDGGNSKSVFLGGLYTLEEWQKKLDIASERPEKWIVQDYYAPPRLPVLAHGLGARELPTQLGIFVLPSPEDPTQFDMDITVKSYAGSEAHFTFDPSGLKPDIWFGHVIELLPN